MRVLISAYLCAPNVGSEEEVAMSAVKAAASRHDVWLLTHRDSCEEIEAELARLGLADRVTVLPLDIEPPVANARDRSLPIRHWAYDHWQRQAEPVVLELDRQFDFDVVHHATIASYWTRCALDVVDKPFVLGPVGGGVTCPPRMLPSLGVRGAVGYLSRTGTRNAFRLRSSVRRSWDRADLILAQNQETASKLPANANVEIFPNGLSSSVSIDEVSGTRTKELIFAGRLLAWKAVSLAVRALSEVKDSEARLLIYGSGPEKERLKDLVASYGLDGRVEFCGRIARDDLHRRLATAGAMVHPAVHDESSLSMSEAMLLGTPVVALNRGGVVTVSERIPGAIVELVNSGSGARTASRMAVAIDRCLENPPEVKRTPSLPEVSFGEKILASYDQVVRLHETERGVGIDLTDPRLSNQPSHR